MYVASTKQPRNFVKAYHDVLRNPDLNPTDKLVYLTLLSYQEAGLQVFPSNEHVAESLAISKDSVIRATKKLVELGAIEKTRRFNKSNLVTVNNLTSQLEVANCNVQRSQIATSRGSKMQLYKNRDNNKNKISKEEEGQNQASLSQEDDGLEETRIHCDESVSDLNLAEGIFEKNSVKKGEVTQTYASMPSDPDEDYFEPDTDSDYMDDEAVHQMEQRAEQRNQQISAHFSTQQQQSSSAVPSREEYQHMMSANRIKQFDHKPNKPDWL